MRLMVMPVGRRPGFFRITGKKYFVLYRSQVENISYPTDHRQNLFWFFPDHRQKLFRTLPSTGKNYFVPYRSQAKPILVFSGSQAKTISYSTDHRQNLFRTLPITGKKYLNNNFSPCSGPFDPNSPKFPDKFPEGVV